MDDSIWSFLTTLSIDLTVFFIEFNIFSLYRKVRNKPVYLELEGKDIKVPVFSESDTPLWELFKGVWNVPYEEIGFYCGLEGKLYLALHRVLIKLVLILAGLACLVLIPVYSYGTANVNENMNILSMAHIIDQDDLMTVVLVYFMLVTVITLAAILLYIREVSISYSMPSELTCTINKYAIEIRGLPNDFPPHDAAIEIKDIFLEQFPDDIISVYVVPNLASTYALQLELDEAKKELYHYQEYLKYKGERATIRNKCYTQKLDAIEYYQDQINILKKAIDLEYEANKNKCAGYAYVLCSTQAATFKILREFQKTTEFLNCKKWTITSAPAPSEINWQNVTEHKKTVLIIRILLLLFFIVFFFILVTPATFLQILMEIFQILGVWTAIKGVFNQFLPSLLLLVYQSAIVRHTVLAIVKHEELGNKSEETISAMFKYLLVMITYTFLVPLLGMQIYTLIAGVFFGGYDEWQSGISNQIAFSGRFFTIYIINLTFLKNGSDFMQIPKLFRVKFRQLRAVNDRERLMAYEAYEFRWPYEYGVSINTMVIILSFSVAYPVILIAGSIFYLSRYFIAKYNMLCFYCTVKTTTGHKIPKVVVAAMLTAILIFQCLTCGLMFTSDSKIYFALASMLLVFSFILFLILFYYRERIEAEFLTAIDRQVIEDEGLIAGEDINKYYQPLDTESINNRALVPKVHSRSETQLS